MKKILFDEDSIINMKMFGIQVPALKSRKIDTLEALLKHEELKSSQNEWLITDKTSPLEKEDLERIHSPQYLKKLFAEDPGPCFMDAYELVNDDGSYNRYIPDEAEAPMSKLREQVLGTCGGTYYASLKALKEGFCYYLGGGMHHGHRDFGHGFCPTNDIMASAAKLIAEKKCKNVWVIDVDAHKGDGTAEIASPMDKVKTLSIHMAEGWPLDSPQYDSEGILNPAWFPSDIDIDIKSGEEGTYNSRLLDGMKELEALSSEKPDLAIVLLGADPYEKDELDSTSTLKMTEEQLLERDQLVHNFLTERGIPAAYTMAGGYGKESWRIHYNFLKWILMNE